MKILSANLPESYIRLIEENFVRGCFNRPEHIRIAVRELIRNGLTLSGISEREPQQKGTIRFFDCCINCGRILDTIPKRNHFFHKTFEIFSLKFCCSCFKDFKDKTLDEFPEDLIDKIRKKIKAFKENEEKYKT